MTYQNKTIQKHVRGNWFARVRFNGKYIYLYGKTQLEAYEKLKAFCDKIEQVVFDQKFAARLESLSVRQATTQIATVTTQTERKTYTLKEWYDEWFEFKKGSVRENTLLGFKNKINHLKHLYDTDIREITNLTRSRAINDKNLGHRTKDGIDNMVKQMFAVAFNNRLIDTNPALNLPRPKQTPVKQMRAFTEQQEKQFIEKCLTNTKYEPFIICVLQGLRKGEMLALRPNDFDFAKNILRIDESYDEQTPNDLQTKNLTSNRKMPMFEMTKRVLEKYRDTDPEKFIYKIKSEKLYANLAELYENTDLPKLSVHELRHTFITRCHEKKIDEIVVQKWVGHAIGSRMTKAVYTHVNSDAEQNYIDILNGKTE